MLFGKNKTKGPGAAGGGAAAGQPPASSSGGLDRLAALAGAAPAAAQGPAAPAGRPAPLATEIVVADAALAARGADPLPLLADVVGYANALMQTGYAATEVSPNAMRAYLADFYAAQVSQTGHAGYFGAGLLRDLNVQFAEEGLAACGATEALAVLREALAWVAANPFKAMRCSPENSFEARELLALDKRFADAGGPTALRRRTADWLAGLPELRAAPAASLAGLMAPLKAAADPATRDAAHEAERAYARETDVMALGLDALAARAAQPIRILQALEEVPTRPAPDGFVRALRVETDQGDRVAVLFPQGAALVTPDGQTTLANITGAEIDLAVRAVLDAVKGARPSGVARA